jgi:hypothetical protein
MQRRNMVLRYNGQTTIQSLSFHIHYFFENQFWKVYQILERMSRPRMGRGGKSPPMFIVLLLLLFNWSRIMLIFGHTKSLITRHRAPA